MVNYNAPLYQHPREIWDVKKCEKLVKHIAKDGLGTPYPFKGYIRLGNQGDLQVRYNGGCVRDGEWWQGEEWQLPKLADGFELVRIRTWGWRIIKVKVEQTTGDWV